MANIPKEWLEKTISDGHINYIEYNKLSNPIETGNGAFGNVFKYDWKDCELTVALKCLIINTSIDEKIIKDFIDELKILRKVSCHPCNITFYGVTKSSYGHYNMILEYANEGTLRKYLKTNFTRLQWTDKLHIAKEITFGLLFLHNNDIVHRDLHSNNILIHEGKPKITDFGLSKQINEASKTSTAFGMVAYVDPKYLDDIKYKRNKKSDVYSIGVILWEISSGRPPFPYIDTEFKLAFHILKGNREESIEDSPTQYIKLYKQCWDNDPSNRPETKLILDALEQLIPNNIKNLRKNAHECLNQGEFLKALELFEKILKNNHHNFEDKKSASSWNLSNNRCGSNKIYELSKMLCKDTTLTSLDLSNNELGTINAGFITSFFKQSGIKALTYALCKNSTLTSLNL
ncbi:kinase-like protein [Gigaspora margarita]|uniref:Kinase-like protein n=1 Tax=Gigaspora margarita TaxID=4874 RepID=A0A8H3WZ90_GIGMA|nr:kinase-like protein [Gigaspora margarita]